MVVVAKNELSLGGIAIQLGFKAGNPTATYGGPHHYLLLYMQWKRMCCGRRCASDTFEPKNMHTIPP
eukprot:1980779-Amphidinium_carterae.1